MYRGLRAFTAAALVVSAFGIAEFFDWYNPASSHPSIYAIEEMRFC